MPESKGKKTGKKTWRGSRSEGGWGRSIQVLDLMNQFIKIVPEAQG